MRHQRRKPAIDRLLAKRLVDENGCWIFTGYRDALGYGKIGNDGRRTDFAHRVAYENLVGPIPDGLVIDHLCRQTGCFNPDHLEAVTHVENRIRGLTPGAIEIGFCKRGHEWTEENTYWRGDNRRMCRPCQQIRMARYNLARSLRRRAARA